MGEQWQLTRLCVSACVHVSLYKPCVYSNTSYLCLFVWAHACLCGCGYSMFLYCVCICSHKFIYVHWERLQSACDLVCVCVWVCVCVCVCEWNMQSVHVFKMATLWCRLQYLKCSTISTDLGCASVARAEVSLLIRFLLISSPCVYRAALAGPGAKPILFDSP